MSVVNIQVPLCFLETNFVMNADVVITAPSYPGRRPDLNQPGEPPESAEYAMANITLRFDRGKRSHPRYSEPLELPAWLQELIGQDPDVMAAAEETENAGPDPDALYEARRDAEMEG